MKISKKLVSLILSLSMIIGIAATMPVGATANTATFNCDTFTVIHEVMSAWGDTQNVNVTIKNTSKTIIENWALAFTPGGTIERMWNAKFTAQEDGAVLVINEGWNADIPIGGSVNFGYAMVGANGSPDNFVLATKRVECETSDFEAKYQVYSDWGSGFSAAFELRNNTDEPINGWQLAFDGEITSITGSEFVVLESADNHFVIKGKYTANIPAKSSIYLSFNGVGEALVYQISP